MALQQLLWQQDVPSVAFLHMEFCEAAGNEGMGSAEQRYCILEARVLCHNEDQRKQTEEMHAMATGAVFCGAKERGLEPRILTCLPSCYSWASCATNSMHVLG